MLPLHYVRKVSTAEGESNPPSGVLEAPLHPVLRRMYLNCASWGIEPPYETGASGATVAPTDPQKRSGPHPQTSP